MTHLGSFAEEFNKHLEQTNQINSIQDHIDHDITNTLNKKKPQVPDKNSLKEVEINGSMELGSNPSEPTTQLLREKSEDKRKIFLKANFEQETLDWNNEEDVRVRKIIYLHFNN